MDIQQQLRNLNLGLNSSLNSTDLKHFTEVFKNTKDDDSDIILLIKVSGIANLRQFEDRISSFLYPSTNLVDYDTVLPSVISCLFYAWGLWEKYYDQLNDILFGEYDKFLYTTNSQSWTKYCILSEYLRYLRDEDNSTKIAKRIIASLQKIKLNRSSYSNDVTCSNIWEDLRKIYPEVCKKYNL
jgi:hypothetical protein